MTESRMRAKCNLSQRSVACGDGAEFEFFGFVRLGSGDTCLVLKTQNIRLLNWRGCGYRSSADRLDAVPMIP